MESWIESPWLVVHQHPQDMVVIFLCFFKGTCRSSESTACSSGLLFAVSLMTSAVRCATQRTATMRRLTTFSRAATPDFTPAVVVAPSLQNPAMRCTSNPNAVMTPNRTAVMASAVVPTASRKPGTQL